MEQQCKDYTTQCDFLYNAINDTQENIRFNDTKAGVVVTLGVGLIAGVVTLIDKYISLLNGLPLITKYVAIIGISLFLLFLFNAIILSIRSINPANNPTEHIKVGNWSGLPSIKFYLSGISPEMRWEDYLWELGDSKLNITASNFYDNIMNSKQEDILRSLTFEFLKLSYIKEKKIQRCKVAIKSVERCLWIALLTTALTIMTYNTEFISTWGIGQISINIFLYLIIGHTIGDFLLQTKWQAENKYRIWKALILHSIVYTIIVYIMSLLAGGISLLSVLLIFISHILLDKQYIVNWWIRHIKKENEDNRQIHFLVDQTLHIIIILIVSFIK